MIPLSLFYSLEKLWYGIVYCNSNCTVSEIAYGDLLAENCVFFLPLSYLASPLPIFSSEFCGEINHRETRVMGLLCGESCMILTSNRFWLIHPCDRQTDRQTDGRAIACARYSIIILSRAKTWVVNVSKNNCFLTHEPAVWKEVVYGVENYSHCDYQRLCL